LNGHINLARLNTDWPDNQKGVNLEKEWTRSFLDLSTIWQRGINRPSNQSGFHPNYIFVGVFNGQGTVEPDSAAKECEILFMTGLAPFRKKTHNL